jgi:phage terminase large subunit-like protein
MKQPPKVVTLSDMLGALSDGLKTSITSVHSYRPHPKQQIFHTSECEMKLFIGGNRSGKTVANVVECIWRLTKKHPFRKELNEILEPIRARFVTVNFNEGLYKIVLPLFKQWLPAGELIERNWDKSYNKQLRTLTLANGSFIEFMSYDQDLDAFAGTSRHFVSFDEEPPMSIFNECMMRIIDTDGDWWISMTPVEGLTWVYQELYQPVMEEGKIDPDLLILEVSIHDNPHITEKGKSKILGRFSAEERGAREEGKFMSYGGRVFKDFDKNLHVLPLSQFNLTVHHKIYTSVDTGWRHPAAWLWHAVSPMGFITTFHEIVRSETTVEQFAAEIKRYESSMKKVFPWFDVYVRTGDPALKQTREITGTSVLQEYANHGIYIFVEGIPRDVMIGVNKVTQYLQSKVKGRPVWQCTDDCEILAKQMHSIRWAKHASKKMEYEKAPKTEIDKKDDDAPDSLRYFMTMMDDLSPEKVQALQSESNLIPSAVPYYTGIAPAIEPDYQTFSGSLITNMEG